MPAPTKLTPKTAAAVAAAVARGEPLKAAAEGAGVDEATVYRWLQKARTGRRLYAAFARRLVAARAAYEAAVDEEMRRRREAWLRTLEAQHELTLQQTLARIRG